MTPRSTIQLILVTVLWCLPLFGCGRSTVDPSGDLQGSWAENISIPGASLILTLNQAGPIVTGTGTYAIEAGRAGILQVAGTYTAPAISLTLSYDYGTARTFTGTRLDANHIGGTFSDGGVVTFTRR